MELCKILIEVPPRNGSTHGTPRFTVVPTIAKPALGCQGLDIIEVGYPLH
jgi:hypothetical protein